jgi:hypothetical protein
MRWRETTYHTHTKLRDVLNKGTNNSSPAVSRTNESQCMKAWNMHWRSRGTSLIRHNNCRGSLGWYVTGNHVWGVWAYFCQQSIVRTPWVALAYHHLNRPTTETECSWLAPAKWHGHWAHLPTKFLSVAETGHKWHTVNINLFNTLELTSERMIACYL